MKVIELTKGQVAIVDDEDYDYLNQFKWHADKSKNQTSFYAKRKINGKQVGMHRFIMKVADPEILVDHRDHDGLNNQKYNLRVADKSQNCANRRSVKNSTSKFLGVHWDKTRGKWMTKIKKGDTNKMIGRFYNETEAAIAYNNEAIKLHGEFANLNVI